MRCDSNLTQKRVVFISKIRITLGGLIRSTFFFTDLGVSKNDYLDTWIREPRSWTFCMRVNVLWPVLCRDPKFPGSLLSARQCPRQVKRRENWSKRKNTLDFNFKVTFFINSHILNKDKYYNWHLLWLHLVCHIIIKHFEFLKMRSYYSI